MNRFNFLLTGLLFLIFFVACSTDGENNPPENMAPPMVQRTSIPDSNFESALVELGLDDMVDGSVVTSNISGVDEIVIENKGISNLQGIEDFTVLEGLWVSENNLTSLNLSSNSALKFIFANNNQLTSLNVRSLSDLEKISVLNNQLTTLNIVDNQALQQLSLANNDLSAIDISLIVPVIQLNTFEIENNPLTCIKVNMDQLDNIPPQWTKDAEDTYALECN